MKKTMMILALITVLLPLGALDVGFSLAPWSFTGGVTPGTYAGGGFNLGLTPRWEAEVFAVTEVTPAPADTVLAGIQVGFSLLGDRIPTYFNSVIDLGFIHGIQGLNPSVTGGAATSLERSNYLLLRLSPLAIGNPYFGMRDRIFSVGLLYRIEDRSVSWIWNWVIFNRYR
jgi:hypothetical protein